MTEYLPGLIETELSRSPDGSSPSPRKIPKVARGPLAAQLPEHVARQLVDGVRHPRPVMYSSFGARTLCWLIESPRFRRPIASRIGRTRRRGGDVV